MKTDYTLWGQTNLMRFLPGIIICLFFNSNVLIAQEPFIVRNNHNILVDANNFFQYSTQIRCGLDLTYPLGSLFNIRSDFNTQPNLQLDTYKSNFQNYDWYGTIQHWKYNIDDDILYAIYQTSNSSQQTVKNFFQDPVKIGNIELKKGTLNNSVINIDKGVSQLNFIMEPDCTPSCDKVHPLTITYSGIKVQSNLITDNFQLLTSPGLNKVLVSDEFGNGSWTDIKIFTNDYWALNLENGVYLNTEKYPRLGVGARIPIDQFQVNSGTSAVSIGSVNDQSMDWGNGYLGFNLARRDNLWYSSSDLNSRNGGSTIYNDDNGNLFFVTIPSGLAGSNPLSDQTIKENRKFVLTSHGDVGIGTLNTFDYKLAVNGTIGCKKIIVEISSPWPDYICSTSYTLPPLKEVEQYMNEKKHLPEMPSEEEVKKNGIDVGEMNIKLLKKIEELTKYLIKQQSEIDELKVKLQEIGCK